MEPTKLNPSTMAENITATAEHFRTREKPRYFFTPATVQEIATLIQERFPNKAENTIDIAHRTLRHEFRLPGTIASTRWVARGPKIEWDQDPVGDPEFVWITNRHEFWIDLARAYRYTGDERYIGEWLSQLHNWRASFPVPQDNRYLTLIHPWRLLEAGHRVDSWIEALYLTLDTPALDDLSLTNLLIGLYEHASYLYAYTGNLASNQTIREFAALFKVGLLFPEFDQAEVWREHALAGLLQCMKHQILPDGVHHEVAPGYHLQVVWHFAEALLLARLNDYQMPPIYKETLNRMADFVMYSLRPDGRIPPFGDSDAEYYTGPSALATLALLFKRNDLAYRGLLRERNYWLHGPDVEQEWKTLTPEPPASASHAFDDGGYYLLRDNLKPDGHYAMFDCGPMGGWHGHADLLHFELDIFGRPALIDPGRYTYIDNAERHYFKSTAGHNTVVVDGRDQTEYISGWIWGPQVPYRRLAWQSEPDYDMVAGEHSGYAPVIHRRIFFYLRRHFWIVVDWLKGSGDHTYTAMYHHNTVAVKYDMEHGVETHDAGKANLLLLPLGPEAMQVATTEGAVSEFYGQKRPAAVTEIRLQGSAPTWMAVVLIPQARDTHTEARAIVEQVDVENEEIRLRIQLNEKVWRVTLRSEGVPQIEA